VDSFDFSYINKPQSINQRSPHKATHGPRRSHIPAPPQGGGQTLHHASRSDAGLGGYERVATAQVLVCETRSFSTRFIYVSVACNKTDGRHLRRRLLSWGGEGDARAHVVQTYIIPAVSNNNSNRASMDCDYVTCWGRRPPRAPRNARWPIAHPPSLACVTTTTSFIRVKPNPV